MNQHVPEFYRYSRSKGSSFGHSARKRNPIEARKETKLFLDQFTKYKITLPVEIKLIIDNNKKSFNNIVSLFGNPYESSDKYHEWKINTQLNEKLNSFIEENLNNESIDINLHIDFYWKKIDKKSQEKYLNIFNHYSSKGYHGDFSIYISNSVFIQPEFIVPIENARTFQAFMDDLIKILPFKFSNKSFKSYYSKLLKNGKTSYKSVGYYNENS